MDVFDTLFSTSGLLQVLPVNHSVLIEAATLKAKERLGLPDAIHAAASRLAGCAAFVTEVRALLKVTGLFATDIAGLSVG